MARINFKIEKNSSNELIVSKNPKMAESKNIIL